MSFHSSQDVKTSIIDPVCDRTNFKTLFKLDSNTTHLSNMRLLDVGVKVANTPTHEPARGCIRGDQENQADGWQDRTLLSP